MRPERFLAPAAIALAGLLAYSSAFPGAFVFDDAPNVSRNPQLDRPLDYLPGRPGYAAQPNRAVTFATFAIDRAIAGNDPTFHRAVNVAIHVGSALLVLGLALSVFRAPRLRRSALAPSAWAVGMAAGLIFATHPIQTQAVSYVVQRLASLATLFYLLSALLYVRWRNGREAGARGWAARWSYAGALVAAVLAMRSKEIAFTLPVALLLLEAVLFEGPWRRRLAALLPFAATMALIPATLLLASAPAGTAPGPIEPTRVQTSISRGDYLLTQFTVVARYLGLLVFPAGQTIDHDVPLRHALLDPAVLGSALLLLAMALLAGWLLLASSSRRPRPVDPAARLAALGIGWFFLALSVESSLIPIVDLMYEHRVYLPFAGLSLSIATLLALGARRVAPDRVAAITAAAGLLLAAVLGAVTWRRNEAWSSEVALWTDAVAKSPGKARPRHNLGVALNRLGRRAEAMSLLQDAVRLDPAYAQGHESLGVALGDAGRPAEAEAHFRRAIDLDPKLAEPWFDLGTLRFEAGRYAEAAPYFEQAIARHRAYADAYANLAACWNALGRYPDAVRLLRGAEDVIRARPLARAQLALALAQLGDLPAARREVEAIRPLAPGIAAQLQAYLDGRGAPPR
jgi:tetratricopeptide (TPR) repeat protein